MWNLCWLPWMTVITASELLSVSTNIVFLFDTFVDVLSASEQLY